MADTDLSDHISFLPWHKLIDLRRESLQGMIVYSAYNVYSYFTRTVPVKRIWKKQNEVFAVSLLQARPFTVYLFLRTSPSRVWQILTIHFCSSGKETKEVLSPETRR